MSSTGAGGAGANSETATKVRNLGLQAQLALLSILLASKRLEAGLFLSGSPSSTSPKPKSPIKRTSSASSSTLSNTSGTGIETTTLHTYYTTVLTRASNEVFTPVSRSEFADVVGMLEVVGLACLSSAMSASPVKGKRTFGRSASFGGAGGGKGVSGGEVKIAEGVRVDEVLRGLGVGSEEQKDIRAEEICAIWEKEKARLGKDVRAFEAKQSRVKGGEVVFGDAMED
jgi:cell division control protein 6